MADAPRKPRKRRQPPLLVFIHIPKTAGTTLHAVLRMNEPGSRTQMIGNVFKGFGGIDPAPLERLRDEENAPDLSEARILRGHLPFGVRKYLPKDRKTRYFTFLREPVDRTLSHYFQIRESPERPFGLPPFPAEGTLEDAFEDGYLFDNLQTRMLSGLAKPFGEVTERTFEKAKQNLLKEFELVGLAERFDESLVLMMQRLGFRSILYPAAKRVNSARPRGADVPEELVQAAKAGNRYDLELYRHAQELFDDAPEHEELEFAIELAALREAKADAKVEVKDLPAGVADTPPALRELGERLDAAEGVPRMLIDARASVLRLEAKLHRSRQADVEADETFREELDAARSRTKELEQEVEDLKSAAAAPRPRGAKRGTGSSDRERAGKAPKRRPSDARQEGKSKLSTDDADALADKLQVIADARKLASEQLDDLRGQIRDLEATMTDDSGQSGPNGRGSAEERSALKALRRQSRNLKQRIDELEQRRARFQRQLAALSEERGPK